MSITAMLVNVSLPDGRTGSTYIHANNEASLQDQVSTAKQDFISYLRRVFPGIEKQAAFRHLQKVETNIRGGIMAQIKWEELYPGPKMIN